VTWDPYLTPSSWHGVMTVVMGIAALDSLPSRGNQDPFLIGLMEGVEDLGAPPSPRVSSEDGKVFPTTSTRSKQCRARLISARRFRTERYEPT
jgi:N-acyl-D-aspartate/D-glutamate deacylase